MEYTDYRIGSFIVMMVQAVVFMIPIIVLVYRQGKKDQVLDGVVRDTNGLGKKVAELRESQTHTLAELKAQLDNMNTTLVRVTTQMEFFTKALEELKK